MDFETIVMAIQYNDNSPKSLKYTQFWNDKLNTNIFCDNQGAVIRSNKMTNRCINTKTNKPYNKTEKPVNLFYYLLKMTNHHLLVKPFVLDLFAINSLCFGGPPQTAQQISMLNNSDKFQINSEISNQQRNFNKK